ncbi:hypothetical protein H2203_001004 [Taxawa tesnikishii (nom. ined.)]|nr:hypothetical protein H2203_001004 [Dothideales sp. JES 119]
MPTLAGKQISQNGLGLMRLTMPHFQLPDAEAFRVLRCALAAGVNVWNAADYYGTPTANSLHLLNRYFTAYPSDADNVVLCVKTGLVDRRTVRVDCSPSALRRSADAALAILDGKKKVDVFGIPRPVQGCPAPGTEVWLTQRTPTGLSRVDPNVPVEESVRALDELRSEGKFAGLQLSEVRASTIRRAAAVAKIDMVEAEASVWSPMVFENGVAEACAELGIIRRLDDLPADSPLRALPRYQPDVFDGNMKLVRALEKLARAKGCTTTQLALGWLKAHTGKPGMPVVVPVAGARSEEWVRQNAVRVELTGEDFATIEAIQRDFPVLGYRTMPIMAEKNEY